MMRSCRSSIALHFAASRAAATLQPALVLCSRMHMEQQLPLLPHEMDAGQPLLQAVHFKYVRACICVHGCMPHATAEDLRPTASVRRHPTNPHVHGSQHAACVNMCSAPPPRAPHPLPTQPLQASAPSHDHAPIMIHVP